MKLELAGLTTSFEAGPVASAKFDLSFALAEERAPDGTPAGIAGVLEYAADLFDETTATSLAERLVRLLTAAAEDPARPIGTLDILSPDERAHHPDAAGTTPRAPSRTPPSRSCSPHRPRSTPDAVALVYEDRDAQLPRARRPREPAGASSALARRRARDRRGAVRRALVRHGGRAARHPQGRRRLPAARSGLPAERLAFMLADAGRAVLITQVDAARAACPRITRASCDLDADRAAIARQPATAPPGAIDPAHRRLRHLHLGLHRTTKGRRRHPCGARQSHAVDGARSSGCRRRRRAAAAPPSASMPPLWEIWLPLVTGAALCCRADRDGARSCQARRR